MLFVILIAGVAALASVSGGLIALWRQPTTYFISLALGFTSGVLIAAITVEMVPRALELSSLLVAAAGFITGYLAIYAFDLFVYHGRLAGEQAEQRKQVERFYQQRPPRGSNVTVLAGGTSAEELIEGVSIGIGAAINPGLGLVIAAAIAVDNLSEGLSIGEIVRIEREDTGARLVKRVLGWTGVIGAAVFGSTLVGWFLLRWLPDPVLGFLLALGSGGMLYLTVTDLVPTAEKYHFQESSALATGAGFLVILILSELV